MSEFKVVGKSIPRLDGPEKVAGRAMFLADCVIPGAWVGGTLRSEIPYGRLKSVTKSPGFDWSKVVVVTAHDLPARNFVHIVRDEYPVLAEKTVNYVTQPIALVAAPDKRTLREALAHMTVDVEPMEPVMTIEESLAGKTVIWGTDNVVDEYRVHSGDLDEGFAKADFIVEGTYSTGLQEQMYLETQGMAAIPGDDGCMELIGSVQCPYYVLGAVATVLGIDRSKVRVRQTETGGGFGGKEDYPSILGAHVALLASKAGRPVVMIYDRMEDLHVSPKRHPSIVRHRSGVSREGKLTAVEIDLLMDAGAYTTLTMVVLQRSVLHALGAYHCPNVSVRGRAMATNTPPTGAFRGFGAPQSLFAIERQMDRIARELGMNPLDLRLANTLRNGMAFPFKQVLDTGVSGHDVLVRVAELSDYRAKRERYAKESADAAERGERYRRGIGISVALHGGGFTGRGEDVMGTTTRVAYKDGRFLVYTSSVDMGQGSVTVLPQIAAECLGVPIDLVRHPLPDTWTCPDSGPTVASRSTMFIGNVVKKTCLAIVERLRVFIGEREASGTTFTGDRFQTASGGSFTTAEAADLYVRERGALEETCTFEAPRTANPWDPEKFEGDAYKGYAWIAQAIEVEVDMDTYEVTPTLGTVVAEVGRAINPQLASGQVEGGVLQGCGWSHIESLEIDDKGRYSAGHMSEYLVPTTLDAPKWNVEMMEVPCDVGPFGAKGLGELPANGGAPAFLAAVENATGVFADSIPLTGEKLWMALEKLESEGDEKRGGESVEDRDDGQWRVKSA